VTESRFSINFSKSLSLSHSFYSNNNLESEIVIIFKFLYVHEMLFVLSKSAIIDSSALMSQSMTFRGLSTDEIANLKLKATSCLDSRIFNET